MNKFQKWLSSEIELWQADGIINSEQAQKILARYQHEPSNAWGTVVFSAIGAVIFGLGIILLFAYNWEEMGRFTKLALILSTLLLAHGFGHKYTAIASKHPKIGESLLLLGTMFFGAAIWLIAQIYHIDEHYPNGILIWALGALTLAWAVPSLAQAMLAMALLTMWHWMEAFDFDQANHLGSWLIAFGIIPMAWIYRSRALLFFSISVFFASYAVSVVQLDMYFSSVISLLFSMACGYIIISHIVAHSQFPQSQGIFRVVGLSVYTVILFAMGFGDTHNEFYRRALGMSGAIEWLYWVLPLMLVVFSLLVLFKYYLSSIVNKADRIEMGIIFTALLVVLMQSLRIVPSSAAGWVLLSALFLAHALLLIWRGTQILRWQSTALGCLMLSAFTFARFLDLFQSLLMRSLAFLMLGAALFAIGIFYSKQKQRQGVQTHA